MPAERLAVLSDANEGAGLHGEIGPFASLRATTAAAWELSSP